MWKPKKTCRQQDCSEPLSFFTSYQYCSEHRCRLCSKPRATPDYCWCRSHKCRVSDCPEPCLEHRHCLKHRCPYRLKVWGKIASYSFSCQQPKAITETHCPDHLKVLEKID